MIKIIFAAGLGIYLFAYWHLSQPHNVIQWNHSGNNIVNWILCIDDNCRSIPRDDAATRHDDVWRVKKPPILDNGATHVITLQACTIIECSGLAETTYRKGFHKTVQK